MYVPNHFKEDDLETLSNYMKAASFATLITSVDGVPYASHLPFHIDKDKGEFGTLYAHLARANEHWKYFGSDNQSLTIFTGSNAFVSANWMNSVNALPTWNYAAVHAYGHPRIIDDADAILELLATLNKINETDATGSWTTDKMDQGVLQSMLKGIVAFEIPIMRIEGKRKMNQNKSSDIQKSVISGLRSTKEAQSCAVADDIEAALDKSS